MENKKEWHVPDELKKINNEFLVFDSLMETYARLPFGYKKALKLSIKTQQKKSEFWENVYNLYPELQFKKCTYSAGKIKLD